MLLLQFSFDDFKAFLFAKNKTQKMDEGGLSLRWKETFIKSSVNIQLSEKWIKIKLKASSNDSIRNIL